MKFAVVSLTEFLSTSNSLSEQSADKIRDTKCVLLVLARRGTTRADIKDTLRRSKNSHPPFLLFREKAASRHVSRIARGLLLLRRQCLAQGTGLSGRKMSLNNTPRACVSCICGSHTAKIDSQYGTHTEFCDYQFNRRLPRRCRSLTQCRYANRDPCPHCVGQ